MGATNYVAFESIISYILYGMLPISNNYNNLSLEYLVLEYVMEFLINISQTKVLMTASAIIISPIIKNVTPS